MTARTTLDTDWTVPEALSPSSQSARGERRHRAISLPQAMALARAEMPDIASQPLDGIASAERGEDGWRIVAEVVESRARVGNNDLLAAFELLLDADGELLSFRRLRRYHREDRDT